MEIKLIVEKIMSKPKDNKELKENMIKTDKFIYFICFISMAINMFFGLLYLIENKSISYTNLLSSLLILVILYSYISYSTKTNILEN